MGERYTIKLLTESPEAELTRGLGPLPRGTRFLLNETNDTVIPPNPQARADERQSVAPETNREAAFSFQYFGFSVSQLSTPCVSLVCFCESAGFLSVPSVSL